MQEDQLSLLRVVTTHDPALDRLRMPFEAYHESRDPALVMELPGQHARWFSIRALTATEVTACDALESESRRYVRAFQLACTSIENFEMPGVSLFPTLHVPRPDGSARMMWRESEIDLIADMVGMESVYEIGFFAWERRRLGKWGGAEQRFTSPAFLAHVLERIRRLRAEHTAMTAGTPSSANSTG